MKGITDQEKAALYFQVIERCEDWRRIYAIAIGKERFNALKDNAKQSNTSKWKTSVKIKFAHEEIKRNYKALIEEEREKAVNQYLSEETEPAKGEAKRRNSKETDFLNRDEFLKFLNTRANQITDDKLRNDILKMLSDNMRYKESEKEGENEIQRFYTPVVCETCEIYKKCKGCNLPECPNV